MKMTPRSDMTKGSKRLKACSLLAVFVFGMVSTLFLATPKPALAVLPVADAPVLAALTGQEIKGGFEKVLVETAVLAIVNAANYFTQQLAYQAAKALTSDCPGQVVCWDSKSFESGFKQAWQGAIGEGIGTLSRGLFGNDFLCNPGIPMLVIQLGLLKEIVPGPPKCDFNTLISSWDSLTTSFGTGEILNKIKPQFQMGQSMLSVSVAGMGIKKDIIDNAKRDKLTKGIMDAAAGGGFSGIRDPASGRVKSPASVTQEEMRRAKEGERTQLDETRTANAGSVAGHAVAAVALNATQTFLMTLVARLWNKLVMGLMSTGDLLSIQPDIIFNPEGVLQPPGAAAAAAIQQARVVPVTTREASQYDPLIHFTTCPGSNAAPNNCVMDTPFANAVRVGDVTPFTVREALKKGMLHADWRLFSANTKERDQDPFCYTYAYCESNLKQLRAARIIPIGWEIAASKVTSQPVTLGEVVANFNNCNSNGTIDASHPWCHLIDPDWVLKIPPTQCRATVFGPTLLSPDSATRSEICVDSPTCLRQDDLGQCTGGWGYCQRERNVWRFQGDQCPAHFNTCRTLKTRSGGAENFLLNTIDVGVCNSDNVGCLAYSLQLNAVTAQNKRFCKDGSKAGAQCAVNGDCAGGTCVDFCPLDKGCLAGNMGGDSGCMVSSGKTECTVTDGSICRLESNCVGGSCACYLSTCRVLKGANSCASTTGDAQSLGDDWRVQPQRFLNKNAQSCSATDNGCSAIIPLALGESLNLVKNGGFEEMADGDGDGSPDHPRYWAPFGVVPTAASGGVLDDTGANSRSGSNAMKVLPSGGAKIANFCTLNPACANDAGCTCLAVGGESGYTCQVVKGQTKCFVTNQTVQDALPVKRNTTYTLSAVFLKGSAGLAEGRMVMTFTDLNGKVVPLLDGTVISNTTYQAADGTPVQFNTDTCAASGNKLVFNFGSPVGAALDSVRASCTFVVDEQVVHASLEIMGSAGAYAFVDDVQLEQGSLTSFHENYGSAGGAVNAKIPPEYLGCSGEETDRPECRSFATVCREQEVGCDRYTPVDGDPSVPAVVGPQDACPAECAGYDIFKQEKTEFDTEKFPVYFIPPSAIQCTQSESGCSQFTNVETEELAYFSKLRLCQKPSTDPKTVYYSWEGSDTAGYQLKVWNLKKVTDATGGESFVPSQGNCCFAGVCAACSQTTIDAGQAADVCADPGSCPNAGVAPCTRLDGEATHCASADDAIPLTPTSAEGLCSRADIDSGDLDCREFYDADGNRHFRKLSKTIILTEACHQYRITVSTEADCDKSNGQWLDDKGQCIYNADVSESDTCGERSNGCRPYKGNASGNVRTIVNDTFEAGVGAWSNPPVTQSSESVVVGGHSLKFPVGANSTEMEVGGMVAAGRSYTMTFWARGSGTLSTGFADGISDVTCDNKVKCEADEGCGCTTVTGLACTVLKDAMTCEVRAKSTVPPVAPLSLNFSDSDPATSAPEITLAPDWKQYSLGPVSAADPAWGTASTKFFFKKNGTGEAYLDNVILKEVPDSIYVVRDSWITPATCDQTPQGVPSPQEMLGCKEYRNAENRQVYLRSFAQLCRDKAVGCQAYSFTQNTLQNPYEESFNAVCQLLDKRGTPEPRTCGKCTMPGGTICTAGGGCACNDGLNSCTVVNGAKDCNVAADEASNCKCDYDVRHPWYADGVPDMPDVCRVTIGESECHFKLDGWDDNTPQATHADRVNIPADDRRFLVVGNDNFCPATAIGCKNLGDPLISYERECILPDAGAGIVGGKCDVDLGCTCGPVFNATCKVAKGSNTCTLSFENGIPGKWNAVTLKDDPAQYGTALCTQPAVGCEEFSAADGKYYFKQPFDRTCSYKEGVDVGGQPRYGWFRKSPTGKDIACYPELLQNGQYYNLYKNADAQCRLPGGATCGAGTAGWDPLTETCPCANPPITTQVCRVAKGYTTCGYQGWVGQCQPEFDRCEEFLDPAASSAVNPKGQPYYYVMNQKLDLASCGGTASLRQHCVLFARTSDPSRLYTSFATYFRSETAANGANVSPENCNRNPRSPNCDFRCVGPEGLGAGCRPNTDSDCNQTIGETCKPYADPVPNDANIIIKVRPDRECAEWLACSETVAVPDPSKGGYKFNCAGFDSCQEARLLGESQECTTWTPRAEVVKDIKRLTADSYSKRDVTYKGWEYSGYSVPGQYPAQYASAIDYRMGVCVNKGTGAPTTTLCWSEGDCAATDRCGKKFAGFCASTLGNARPKPCDSSAECGSNDFCDVTQGATQRVGAALTASTQQCAKDSECVPDQGCSGAYDCAVGSQGPGRCIANLCMYDMRGGPLKSDPINSPSCRGFPEDDAPFPASVVVEGGFDGATGLAKNIKSGFSGANICVDGNACECSYIRAGYGPNGVVSRYIAQSNPRYFGQNSKGNSNSGVCVDGPNDGQPCEPDEQKVSATDPQQAAKFAAIDTCIRDEGGICKRRTQEVKATGWFGYCLDPDYGRNINANLDRYACNLWLPVDQLAGSADLGNQFEDAGYVNTENVLYCQVAKGNRVSGPFPYSHLIIDQMSVVAAGPRGKPGDRVWGWWANKGECDFDSDCAEVRSQDIAYPFTGDPARLGPVNYKGQIYKDEIAGMHVIVNAGYQNWDLTIGDESQNKATHLEFYLTEGNNWRFATLYDDDSSDHDTPNGGVKLKSDIDDSDGGECNWGRNEDDGTPGPFHDRSKLCVRANWDGTTGRLLGFSTMSQNDDDVCSGSTPIGNLAECTVAVTARNVATGMPPQAAASAAAITCSGKQLLEIIAASKDGCPNFLAKVYVEYREWCQELAFVNDTTRGDVKDHKNYAWTDKLWRGGLDPNSGARPYEATHVSARFLDDGVAARHNRINKPWDLKPFGAIPMPTSVADANIVKFRIGGAATPLVTSVRDYILPVYDSDGGSVFTHMGIEDQPGDPTKKRIVFNLGTTVSGVPYACFGDCGGDPNFVPLIPAGSRGLGYPARYVGARNISQYFVAAFNVYEWKKGQIDDYYKRRNLGFADEDTAYFKYFIVENDLKIHGDPKAKAYSSGPSGWDFREVYATQYNAPIILSVNFGNCFGSRTCEEGPAGLTINKVIAGNQTGNGKFKAILNYYAYADKDHMPLRHKIVDWGDGISYLDLYGWYKNHRGSVPIGGGAGKSLCDPLTQGFGGTPQACQNEFFQDIKTYICNPQTVAKLVADGKICAATNRTYPCTENNQCVFRPRVQFTDNWDTCNGSCPNGPGGVGNLCMTETECRLKPPAGAEPWTVYAGEIRINPQ